MNWYYAEGGQPRGPVSEENLRQLVQQGTIREDTLVWREGLANWQPWREVRTPPGAAAPAAPSEPVPSSSPGEPAPTPETSTEPPAGTEPAAAESTKRCVECGSFFPPADLVDFGGRPVCAACKPVFLQRLREGASLAGPAAASSGEWVTAEQLLARDYDLDAVARVSDAWRLLFANPGVNWLGGFLMVVAYFGSLMATGMLQIIPLIGLLASQAFGAVATSVILGGICQFYARLNRGERVEVAGPFQALGPCLGEVFRGSLPLAGISLLMGAPFLFLGATLPFAFGATGPGGPGPGALTALGAMGAVMGIVYLAGLLLYLYFYICWLYAPALIVDKGLPWRDALKLSRAMVRKHPWLNLWLVFFTGLIAAAGLFACCIGLAVSLPLTYATIALQYDRMFRNLTPHTGLRPG